jgi:predicted CXXCH cytochrome family protein
MKRTWLILIALPGLALAVPAGQVAGSKHDLSLSGPGRYRARTESNPCAFCHVPHGSGPGLTSRPDEPNTDRPYDSSTLSSPGRTPSGSSRLCLSCHDGTIAVGRTRGKEIDLVGGNRPMESGSRSNLGTDLRRSHPVSLHPGQDRRTSGMLRGGSAKLDEDGQVQCTSCHDPHAEWGDPSVGKFLVMPVGGSRLCRSCHQDLGNGGTSSHDVSAATVRNEGGRTTTVAELGCLACHDAHGAAPASQLVKEGRTSDAPCLSCHDGTVARSNIAAELSKPSAHASVDRDTHDASEGRDQGRASRRLPEGSVAARRHVTCVDCHDPHALSSLQTPPPAPAGSIAGTWGIDLQGRKVAPVRFEYEVCLKCHGDSANKPQGAFGGSASSAVRRAAVDVNLRRVFSPDAPSFHPVASPGRNPVVPGLRSPLSPASLIRCTDCHGSDQAVNGVARGPHGSIYPTLLERQYLTDDFSPESAASYALCYKCHDRDALLSEQSNFRLAAPPPSGRSAALHRRHVVDGAAPCSACHAAHGVSRDAGTDAANAHLINFDRTIVRPASSGLPRYRSGGIGAGQCNLTCHGRAHDDRTGTYPTPLP